MSHYRTGTTNVVNGSLNVVGVGTDFISGVAPGECYYGPDGRLYEIDYVVSATALVLKTLYLGATANGQTYSILPTQSYIRDLASQAATLVNSFVSVSTNALLKNAADKATPVDADAVGLRDSVTGLGRMLTWANLKAAIKTYLSGASFPIGSTTPAAGAFTTLSATGAVVLPTGVNITSNDGKIRGGYVNSSFSYYYAGSDSGALHDFRNQSGVSIAQISSTGLAITGTLSATTSIKAARSTGALLLTIANFSDTLDGAVSDNLSIGNAGAGDVIIHAGGSERMRLDAGGNLLVGGSAGGGSSGVNLDPSGRINVGKTISGTRDAMVCYHVGAYVGGISYTNTATAFLTSSDYRLKSNPQPLTGSGAFIDALEPKTWEWIQDGTLGAGFLAHEFQSVSPSSVNGVKDETEVQTYEISPAVAALQDAEGNELVPALAAVMGERTVPKYQSMQASSAEVIANIVAELQSLRARLSVLEAT